MFLIAGFYRFLKVGHVDAMCLEICCLVFFWSWWDILVRNGDDFWVFVADSIVWWRSEVIMKFYLKFAFNQISWMDDQKCWFLMILVMLWSSNFHWNWRRIGSLFILGLLFWTYFVAIIILWDHWNYWLGYFSLEVLGRLGVNVYKEDW